jgi:aryl-alcohol dehydrogenase-like predicted oxidoreductase
MAMVTRKLGRHGPVVSALGLGCMSVRTPEDAQQVLHAAFEAGITLFDTADSYGPYTSETAIGPFVRDRRESVVLATKFGNNLGRAVGEPEFDGRPEYVRQAANASLQRLGVDVIDLYYLHRVDPNVPIEDTVGAMAELVDAGKVRHLGLSEAGPNTIRRAHAVHPIAAIQTEWSVFSRDIEQEVAPVARELGIGVVAYSPLGRGLLTGALERSDQVPDRLKNHPRYVAEAFDANRQLVDGVVNVASRLGVDPGQVALAWVLARGSDVVPIPGTRRVQHVLRNIGALDVELTADVVAELEPFAERVVGHRSPRPHAVGVEAPERSA